MTHSGLTEWENCIFLWVNLPEKGEVMAFDNVIWRATGMRGDVGSILYSHVIYLFIYLFLKLN